MSHLLADNQLAIVGVHVVVEVNELGQVEVVLGHLRCVFRDKRRTARGIRRHKPLARRLVSHHADAGPRNLSEWLGTCRRERRHKLDHYASIHCTTSRTVRAGIVVDDPLEGNAILLRQMFTRVAWPERYPHVR